MDFTAGPRPDDSPRAMLDETHRDPDLDSLDEEPTSELDDLRAELTATVAETTLIEVLGRPGYAIRCRLDFVNNDVESIRKKARNKRFADGIDGIRFAALLLAFTCTGIVRQGKDLTGEDGRPLTFTHPDLQAVYGTTSAEATVRKFFAREGHVDAASRRLTFEAGWGDDVYTVDPTE